MGKGQVFIIIAVIVVVAIISIRVSLNLTKILESKRFLELGMERLEFQNLRNELFKAIQVSYNQTNISNNINNFMGFAKESFSGRATIMTGVVLTAMFPNVTSGADTPLNVTFMNHLDEDILSLNLTFNNTRLNFTSVGKYYMLTTSFTFRTNGNINYSIAMDFTTASLNSSENITIPVEIGTAKFIGFFDVKISSDRLEQRDKFTETIILNVTRRV